MSAFLGSANSKKNLQDSSTTPKNEYSQYILCECVDSIFGNLTRFSDIVKEIEWPQAEVNKFQDKHQIIHFETIASILIE